MNIRLLCFGLLLAIVLPLHAQPLEPVVGLSAPGGGFVPDPAFLMPMREKITNELQQIQRMRGIVNSNDTQLIESLDSQQAELTKQLRDIMQQMQAGPTAPSAERIPQMPGGMGGGMMGGMQEMPPNLGGMGMIPQQMPPMPGMMGGMGMMPQQIPPMPQVPPYLLPQEALPQTSPYPVFGGGYNSYDLNRGETAHWGPRLPKELTEVKQSVESLRREIAELKETIKVLETQIQLLNRNILLSERVKENGN